MVPRKYSFIFLLVSFLYGNRMLVDGGKKKAPKPPPAKLQVKYNSTDPTIQQFLQNVDTALVMDMEGTLFLPIASTKYIMSLDPMNWYKAFQMCRLKGGQLVDSIQKFKEVNSYLMKADWPGVLKFWIGATSLTRADLFRWFSNGEDLEPKDFSWAPGQPKILEDSCLLSEKVGKGFFMETVDCEKKALGLCYVLVPTKKGPQAVTQMRKKKKTIRMHSMFS